MEYLSAYCKGNYELKRRGLILPVEIKGKDFLSFFFQNFFPFQIYTNESSSWLNKPLTSLTAQGNDIFCLIVLAVLSLHHGRKSPLGVVSRLQSAWAQ